MQGHQVCRQSIDLVFSEISARLDGVRNKRLRVFQPGLDPFGRQPAACIGQVWTNVSASSADGVARLALKLHFIKLLAKSNHGWSELFRVNGRGIRVGMLQDHRHVVGEGGGVLVTHIELRHAQDERGAQSLRIFQEVDDPLTLRAAALVG